MENTCILQMLYKHAAESPSIFLSRKYGINAISFTNCSGQAGSNGSSTNNLGNKHIAFDYLGRPYMGVSSATNDMATLMQADCEIKFSFDNGTKDLKILIRKETGYTTIVGQPNL